MTPDIGTREHSSCTVLVQIFSSSDKEVVLVEVVDYMVHKKGQKSVTGVTLIQNSRPIKASVKFNRPVE